MTKRMNREELEIYFEERNIDLYDAMPTGWVFMKGALTAPKGTEWIYNEKSISSRQRKTGLLITDK